MMQLKKLKRDYKLAVSAYGLNPNNWLLKADGEVYITIVHKDNGTTKRIDKYAREIRRNTNGRYGSRRTKSN